MIICTAVLKAPCFQRSVGGVARRRRPESDSLLRNLPTVKKRPSFLNNRTPPDGVDAPSLKRAGTILTAATGQFVFFMVLAEIYYPGYDVSTNFVSDLGATCNSGVCKFVQPSSEIFDTSIALLGVALFFVAYYVRKGSGSSSLPFFQALAGVGALGVGVFNESYGDVHVLFSALTFIAGGIQAILVYKVAKSPFSYFAALTGVVTLVATALYVSDDYLGLGRGGMERMVVYPVLISGIALGGYLMALGDALQP